jgi:TonB family protein
VILALGGLAVGQSEDQSSPPPAPPADSEPQIPTRVRVSSGVESGLVIRKVNPEYPKKARKKHIQGTVILTAKIDKNGDIADLAVVSGDPLLAKAATDAVKQWKYKPYFFHGEPVDVETQIQVNFALSRN